MSHRKLIKAGLIGVLIMRLVLLFSVSLLSVLSAQAGEPIFKSTGVYAEIEAHAVKQLEEMTALRDSLRETSAELQRLRTESDAAKAAAIITPRLDVIDEIVKPKLLPVPEKPDLSKYQEWFEDINGVRHHTSDAHLINDHHVDPSELKNLSQEEKNRLHGKKHTEQPAGVSRVVKTVRSVIGSAATSSCPNGQCPWANGPAQGGYRVRRRR